MKEIKDLFDSYIDKFTASIPKGKIDVEKNVERFYCSDLYGKFKDEAINILAKKLNSEQISDEEFDAILKSYDIELNEEQINYIVEGKTPKPTQAPKDGYHWVYDKDNDSWYEDINE